MTLCSMVAQLAARSTAVSVFARTPRRTAPHPLCNSTAAHHVALRKCSVVKQYYCDTQDKPRGIASETFTLWPEEVVSKELVLLATARIGGRRTRHGIDLHTGSKMDSEQRALPTRLRMRHDCCASSLAADDDVVQYGIT